MTECFCPLIDLRVLPNICWANSSSVAQRIKWKFSVVETLTGKTGNVQIFGNACPRTSTFPIFSHGAEVNVEQLWALFIAHCQKRFRPLAKLFCTRRTRLTHTRKFQLWPVAIEMENKLELFNTLFNKAFTLKENLLCNVKLPRLYLLERGFI